MAETHPFSGRVSWRKKIGISRFPTENVMRNVREAHFLVQKNAPFRSQNANLPHFPPLEGMRNDRNTPFLGKESFGATKIGIPCIYTENVVQNVQILPLFDIENAPFCSQNANLPNGLKPNLPHCASFMRLPPSLAFSGTSVAHVLGTLCVTNPASIQNH